jgi:hypothetical protein
MTVIVWDGEHLVTDRKATDGSLKWESSKAWYVSSPTHGVCIVSGVGHLKQIITLRNWIAEGADPQQYPYLHSEVSCQLVVVTDAGLLLYDESPYPIERGFTPCAFGHGRDFAYGALAMGANAEQAVDAANKYSHHCGLGKEVFTLHSRKPC